MAIKHGYKSIAQVYLGSTEIAEIYLGSTKVFDNNQPPPKLTYYTYATGNTSSDSNRFNGYGSDSIIDASGMVYRSSTTASTTASTNISITAITWPGSSGSPKFGSSGYWVQWQTWTTLSKSNFNNSSVRFGLFYLPNTSTMYVGGSSSSKRWRSSTAPTLIAAVTYGYGSSWGNTSFTPPTGTLTLTTPVAIPTSSVLFMGGFAVYNNIYYFPRSSSSSTLFYTSDNDLVLTYA